MTLLALFFAAVEFSLTTFTVAGPFPSLEACRDEARWYAADGMTPSECYALPRISSESAVNQQPNEEAVE